MLSPVTSGPAPRIGELDLPALQRVILPLLLALPIGELLHKSGILNTMAIDALAATPFNILSNLTGTPSMSAPMHWAASEPGALEMPFGAQFTAQLGDDALLFSLAAELEQAAPWANRRPPEI